MNSKVSQFGAIPSSYSVYKEIPNKVDALISSRHSISWITLEKIELNCLFVAFLICQLLCSIGQLVVVCLCYCFLHLGEKSGEKDENRATGVIICFSY